ncbi:MAG: OmpW family protein [Methylophaga sp.]|nr:OmpW family protein [Methylophaga sp.]
MKSLITIATFVVPVLLPLPVLAYDAGDWLVRGRVINVSPNDSSGTLSLNGTDTGLKGVKVDSDTVPELDITYMLTPYWGVELILGYSEHTVKGEKSWAVLGDVIDTKVLPPTLTLQYHFRPNADIRPYVGAGVNYTYFFDEKVPSSSLLSSPGDKVSLDSSWGWALQAGVDIAINQDWFVNVDMKYLDIDTTASFKNVLGNNSAKIDADIDPFVYGIGIGRRF